MQKPRPKEARALRQQRLIRAMSRSNEGASAPFIVSEGEKTAETLANPASGSTLPKADGVHARQAATEPAVIVFGYKERRLPQTAWFTEADADLATRAARLMGLRVLRVMDEAHRTLAARLRRGRVDAADPAFAPAANRVVFDQLCKLAGPVAVPSLAEVTADTGAAASCPATWDAITVGSVVLAHLAPDEGWWEAIVIGAKDDKLVLRWRYYARKPSFTRAPGELALLPPTA
jgi:hypothetical protein